MTSAQASFDARPLTEPVDAAAVRAFAAELRSRPSSRMSASTVVGIVAVSVAAVVMIPVMVGVIVSIASLGGSPSALAIPLLLIVLLLAAVGVLIWMGVRNAQTTRYRLHRFAQANGMSYEPKVVDPPLPGMVFSLGRSRQSTDLIRGTRPRFVEFGNYQYTVQSGKNSTTYRWGYVAVKLDVPLPNIVLDAKGNNGFGSNLPASFQRAQRLSLEGDFDQHFTLYCPAGYERDALYLFTPDIMARFIDNAAQLDVEIVDDWLFLYTQRKVSTLDPATWAWLFGAVGALLTKLDQWARWRDERLIAENPPSAASAAASADALPFAAPAGLLTPPPGVASQGRRLKRTGTWVPIVVVIAFAAFWLLSRMN
ncbi:MULTISPECIES: hypothetical protein [unclassified Microbacterium]|uniref:hypothetical protein n=1 Tax=unclassified Microbacterium TaxID=2609290 RepID=UPI00160537DC|nr:MULTISPECIES: hypothetical protein [unclassified Microbacterium]QNA94002.1 hypothetical protein G4G29_20220 [Microbacterium sp. Se63.02b]QYM64332.1 DUF3137 domain-containing protein [Microbacterium sp. Se5.02b]